MKLAVSWIEEAIKLNQEKYLELARTDEDLDILRRNKHFKSLLRKYKAVES